MISTISLSNKKTRLAVFDILSVIAITLTPALSHMFSVPIYLLEPMRIALILSIVHTSKKNAYTLAAGLPIFSFLISAHPELPKMFLICTELALNVWLFTILNKKFSNGFAVMFSSIILSKIYYYVVKIGLVSFGIIGGSVVATPLYMQVIVGAALSLYAFFIWKKE